MKRWLFRLFALAGIGGLGYGAVTVAQREWGTSEVPAPDFSKPPVNADAAAAVNAMVASKSGARGSATAGDRYGSADRYANTEAPVDPFRGVSRTEGTDGPPDAAADATERRGAAEPQRFTPDDQAAPVPVEPRRNGLRDAGIPSAGEVGLTGAEDSGGASQVETAGATDAAPPGEVAPANGPRYRDPAPAAVGGMPESSAAGKSGPPGAAADRYSKIQPANTQGSQAGPTTDSRAGNARPGDRTGINPATGATTAAEALGAMQDDARVGQGATTSPMAGRYGNAAPPATGDSGANPPGVPSADMESRLSASEAAAAARALPGHGAAGGALPQGSAIDPLRASSGAAAVATPFSALPTSSAGSEPVDPTASSGEGIGKPGDKKLEGAQSPNVTIEKLAPAEIQVGKAAKFEIVVRNTGAVTAENVEVNDSVPQGTQLVSTTPKASTGPRGEVQWKLGDLSPGAENRLAMEVMPVAEGEVGSVATVQFRSAASARTIATKPDLVLDVSAAKQVMIGGDVALAIKISNPGTGAATSVKLLERVPQGLQHAAGGELEFEVGDLKPGESRDLELSLHAVQAGKFANTLVAEGDGNLHTEQTAPIEVVAPGLEVGINGPGLRYLERQAKYTVSVANPGTAAAKNIELVARLPKGMHFVEASDSGQYDSGSHSVAWSMAELPAGQSGSVTLATMAAEAGEQKLRGEVRAAGGLSDTSEQVTVVEGAAAVVFTIVDVDDPVEVGGEATYEIHVVNQGSKAAGKVLVAAQFPPELKPTGADGPAKHMINGQVVTFEALARLAAEADVTYKVVAQGIAPGDLRIKAQLMTEDMREPVTKEESTKVYKD